MTAHERAARTIPPPPGERWSDFAIPGEVFDVMPPEPPQMAKHWFEESSAADEGTADGLLRVRVRNDMVAVAVAERWATDGDHTGTPKRF
jgi:hypothetical protein